MLIDPLWMNKTSRRISSDLFYQVNVDMSRCTALCTLGQELAMWVQPASGNSRSNTHRDLPDDQDAFENFLQGNSTPQPGGMRRYHWCRSLIGQPVLGCVYVPDNGLTFSGRGDVSCRSIEACHAKVSLSCTLHAKMWLEPFILAIAPLKYRWMRQAWRTSLKRLHIWDMSTSLRKSLDVKRAVLDIWAEPLSLIHRQSPCASGAALLSHNAPSSWPKA